MEHPLRCLAGIFAAFLTTLVAAEDQSVKRSPSSVEPRPVSPRVASLLAAAAPKFQPPDTPPPSPSPILRRAGQEESERDIVLLPRFIVRDRALPPPEVADKRAFERKIMDQYLGPRNGVDRGVLNVITIAQIWKKIPILGAISPAPFNSISNEERATIHYKDALMHEYNELLAMTPRERSHTPKSPKPAEQGKTEPGQGSE